ncbi:MAG: 23S rRNA (adenine(2503)-C(2))-methyltransferase RlmN, partial [Pseudohongiella sp.]|nr:23S rRNA (adenine(2503)-C(2))-methyltransferase RlmN [Pseudohongiella sp.]
MNQTAEKTNLLGMSLPMLQAYFQSMGEKPFRAVQVMKWIHQRGVTEFTAMTDISHSLQQKLQLVAEVKPPKIVEEFLAA